MILPMSASSKGKAFSGLGMAMSSAGGNEPPPSPDMRALASGTAGVVWVEASAAAGGSVVGTGGALAFGSRLNEEDVSGGPKYLVTPPSVLGASRLRMRMLAKV